MDTMHLFAGGGGGLLADLILGHTPLVAVEWEPYACQILRERAADGWFPKLSVWEGDVRNFDPSEYTGRVDCIHAGFPCQDISSAGKQAGIAEGTRSGLYREVLRIGRIVRPRFIYLENVAAITSKGLEEVVKDLAQMGYDGRWCCLRASDVGAPHQRDRWWGLFVTNTHCGNGSAKQKCEHERAKKLSRGITRQMESFVADPDKMRQLQQEGSESDIRGRVGDDGQEISNPMSQGLERYRDISCGTKSTHSSSGDSRWWGTEPDVGRVADGVAFRVDRLKALGNGQVPLQAAVAFKILSKGWI